MSPEEVLKMTLQNVMMYNSVIPTYSSDSKEDSKGKHINVTKDNIQEVERLLGL
jgi:hypothetical protein